ncbi:DUF1338-domain-containing protein [Microstroma glucosiphilum]|uniref:2-oxoadipate dioxygenase/decarboxylase n=1 Tax=Pseudomicrostroma glucosiphilum TaxID=1684307 RepID=A0A316U1S9_9BASI|nr:DUF1338-domain-containing protein [Pseudomicrostroma glucosiphilum]PWN18393.1 DUF1338-domain-containing protein [Pseudomicrostroma glucosiphilum]
MYRNEVPLYGDLITLVTDVNHDVLSESAALDIDKPIADGDLMRLTLERHGAIRVGTAAEFAVLAKIFVLLGMSPVGFYDLSECGLPIQATAFRPIGEGALQRNPFRVFTSLLQLDLIPDAQSRQLAQSILQKRDICPDALKQLLDRIFSGVQEGKRPLLSEQDAAAFIPLAIDVFRWHSNTTVSRQDYDTLRKVHPLIADICCFSGPHINHLTPRTLDIDAVQIGMNARGIDAKEIIEGPPRRVNSILLRQTSFKALEEAVYFLDQSAVGGRTLGHHTARFGEIESRGAALTRKGLRLYQSIMNSFIHSEQEATEADSTYQDRLEAAFRSFPDDLAAMREQGLAYFTYSLHRDDTPAERGKGSASLSRRSSASALDQALAQHRLVIRYEPITYEDFLPQSAAGIFSSNLASSPKESPASNRSSPVAGEGEDDKKKAFEEQIGLKIGDYFDLYEEAQRQSVEHVADRLHLSFEEVHVALVGRK